MPYKIRNTTAICSGVSCCFQIQEMIDELLSQISYLRKIKDLEVFESVK